MAENTLYSLVQNSMNQSGNGKLPIGYTVSEYQSVLNSLQKARQIMTGETKSNRIPSGRTVIQRIYSVLGETGYGSVDANTSFVDGRYQAVCVTKDFMSFLVDVTTGSGKKYTAYVANEKDKNCSNLSHIKSGCGGTNNNPIFPATTEKKPDYYTGLESPSSPFQIGVGMDIGSFGLQFFQKFFPNIEWTDTKLKSLMAKQCLFAEVLIQRAQDTSTADVLHSMVIADIADTSGNPFQIYLPVPLLLLDDYKKLGNVIVKVDNTTHVVGSDKVTNTLASKKFNHKKCSIEDFTPKNVDFWTTDVENVVEYVRTDLCSGNNDKKVLVRLFLDKEKKDAINYVVGQIPSEYENELFRGKVEDDKIIKVDKTILGGGVYSNMSASEIEVLEQFNSKLTVKLPIQGLYDAMLVVANFESSGNWTKWKDIGDGQGISAGAFQATEKAGTIVDIIETYVSIKRAEGGDCTEEEKLLEKARSKSLSDSDYLVWKQMYDENNKRMQVAQIKAWTEGFYGKQAIAACNLLKPQSPLAFAAIAGGVNHWPGIMCDNYIKNGMKSSMDEVTKIKYAEATHLKVNIYRQTKNVVSIEEIIKDPLQFAKPEYVGKWKGWCNRCKSVIDGANEGDLDIADPMKYKN